MRFAFLILVASCASHPTCPTLPSLQPSPAPVVQVAVDRPPCLLPPLPGPIRFVGYPSGKPDDTIFVTKSDLVDLGVYLQALRSWVSAASACLEVAP